MNAIGVVMDTIGVTMDANAKRYIRTPIVSAVCSFA
jgi:hypothetical protein